MVDKKGEEEEEDGLLRTLVFMFFFKKKISISKVFFCFWLFIEFSGHIRNFKDYLKIQ